MNTFRVEVTAHDLGSAYRKMQAKLRFEYRPIASSSVAEGRFIILISTAKPFNEVRDADDCKVYDVTPPEVETIELPSTDTWLPKR